MPYPLSMLYDRETADALTLAPGLTVLDVSRSELIERPIVYIPSAPGRREGVFRSDLMKFARKWGIPHRDQKSNERLRKEIWEAQAVEFLFENPGVTRLTNFGISSKREFRHNWPLALSLRKLGVDFNTMLSLIEYNVHDLLSLQSGCSMENLESMGIEPPAATLLLEIFAEESPIFGDMPLKERLARLEPRKIDSEMSSEQQLLFEKVNKFKWPNWRKESLEEFCDFLEVSLTKIDPSKETWIQQVTDLLGYEAREKAIHLSQANPNMRYNEWKKELIRLTVNCRRKTEALYALLGQVRYYPLNNPEKLFARIISALDALKIRNEIECSALAFILLKSLPYQVLNEVVSRLKDFNDVEKIKQEISIYHFKEKLFAEFREDRHRRRYTSPKTLRPNKEAFRHNRYYYRSSPSSRSSSSASSGQPAR